LASWHLNLCYCKELPIFVARSVVDKIYIHATAGVFVAAPLLEQFINGKEAYGIVTKTEKYGKQGRLL